MTYTELPRHTVPSDFPTVFGHALVQARAQRGTAEPRGNLPRLHLWLPFAMSLGEVNDVVEGLAADVSLPPQVWPPLARSRLV